MKGKVPIVLGSIVAFIVMLEIIFVSVTLFRASNPGQVQAEGNTASSGIKIDDLSVTLLSMETSYPGFFTENSICRNRDQYRCKMIITLAKTGFADKSLEIKSTESEKGSSISTEKSESHGTISAEIFEQIRSSIVTNDTFKNWNDNVSVAVSNTKITVQHSHGARIMMSNVDEKTIAFLPLMDAFKTAESAVKWESK